MCLLGCLYFLCPLDMDIKACLSHKAEWLPYPTPPPPGLMCLLGCLYFLCPLDMDIKACLSHKAESQALIMADTENDIDKDCLSHKAEWLTSPPPHTHTLVSCVSWVAYISSVHWTWRMTWIRSASVTEPSDYINLSPMVAAHQPAELLLTCGSVIQHIIIYR